MRAGQLKRKRVKKEDCLQTKEIALWSGEKKPDYVVFKGARNLTGRKKERSLRGKIRNAACEEPFAMKGVTQRIEGLNEKGRARQELDPQDDRNAEVADGGLKEKN